METGALLTVAVAICLYAAISGRAEHHPVDEMRVRIRHRPKQRQ